MGRLALCTLAAPSLHALRLDKLFFLFVIKIASLKKLAAADFMGVALMDIFSFAATYCLLEFGILKYFLVAVWKFFAEKFQHFS